MIKESNMQEKIEISRKMLSVLADELNSATTEKQKTVIMQEMAGILNRVDRLNANIERMKIIESLTNGFSKGFKKLFNL